MAYCYEAKSGYYYDSDTAGCQSPRRPDGSERFLIEFGHCVDFMGLMEIFNCGQFSIIRFSVPKSDSNYSYAVCCSETGKCAVIDPLSPGEIIDYIASKGMSAEVIVNTHSHPDHIAGNDSAAKATGAPVVSHALAAEKTGARQTVGEGGGIAFGNLSFSVMHTPGHCPDHITLLIDGNAFVADTLFLSGCGNTRFGGNVDDLFNSVRRLGQLDDKTRIFCGHNYAETNLEFALSIEPDNADAKRKLDEVRTNGNPVSTIGEEKLYNPFMRCGNESVVEKMREAFPSARSEAEIFAGLRALRNNW